MDDTLLAPDDVCTTSISVKTALNGMQPVNHQQSEALFHVEHPVSARQSVCLYDTPPAQPSPWRDATRGILYARSYHKSQYRCALFSLKSRTDSCFLCSCAVSCGFFQKRTFRTALFHVKRFVWPLPNPLNGIRYRRTGNWPRSASLNLAAHQEPA